jgi:hypothetical protein
MPHMSTAARRHACWLLAALGCTAVGCEALDDDESRDCTLQESYQASFTVRSGECVPGPQRVRLNAPESLETFADVEIETVTARDGCTVQLRVTTRARSSDKAISQLSGSVVPQADGQLRGLFTFTVFDTSEDMVRCESKVDGTLTPSFTTLASVAAPQRQ